MNLQNNIDFSSVLSSLDWIVFWGVSLFSFITLIYAKRATPKEDSQKFLWLDYLLMGRQLSLPLFVASLVATWYGGVFGVTEIAFNSGVYNFVTQGFFWYLSYFVFAIFLIPKIQKFRALTLPHLVGEMYGPKSAFVAGVFNLFNVLPIVYCISLGLLLKSFFSWDLNFSMALGLVVVWGYASWGGFRAVVYTDVYQFVIMFLGVAAVLFLSVSEFGGIDFLKSRLPDDYFYLTGKYGLGETLAWGLIAFSTLVDPNFYQRVFAAKSPQVAKRGILICCGFWFVFDICTTFGAMYAKALLPDAASNTAYLNYAIQILPAGMKGLLFASLVACVLSTLDSYIFTASNTLLYDLSRTQLYKKKFAHILSHAIICLFTFSLAIFFEGNIRQVWKTLGSYSAACLLFPVLFAYVFPKRTSEPQFLISCLGSVLVVSYWRWAGHALDELYIGFLCSGILMILFQPKVSKANV